MPAEGLDGAIAATVEAMSADQVEALVAALEGRSGPVSLGAIAAVAGAMPETTFRDNVVPLLQSAQARQIDASTLALALRSAHEAARLARSSQRVEIAWSGPVTTEIPVRLTREVLLDVIRSARTRLLVLGFAAHDVPEVIRELKAAAARGADVRLVLEGSGPVTDGGAGELARTATTWIWPEDRRPAPNGSPAALEARAAVADGEVAFVTGAHLTGHGTAANMELGVLIRGGPIPRKLDGHLLTLMTIGVLTRA